MEFHLVATPREKIDLPGDLMSASVSLAGVNWANEVALVIDMGERRTGGYRVAVRDFQVSEGLLDLHLQVTQPGPDAFVIQVLTRPYALCRLPRVALGAGPLTIVARDQTGAEVARQVVQL